jgi:hypothetical protein
MKRKKHEKNTVNRNDAEWLRDSPATVQTGDKSSSGLRSQPVQASSSDLSAVQGQGHDSDVVRLEEPEIPVGYKIHPKNQLTKTQKREMIAMNEMRALAGMPLLKITLYHCLKCHELVEGFSDRMCHNCRKQVAPKFQQTEAL